jgi:hypothetical protein
MFWKSVDIANWCSINKETLQLGEAYTQKGQSISAHDFRDARLMNKFNWSFEQSSSNRSL